MRVIGLNRTELAIMNISFGAFNKMLYICMRWGLEEVYPFAFLCDCKESKTAADVTGCDSPRF